MAKQSPIFAKTESFMLWLFQHTAKYPKSERFRLAKRIDDALLNFHLCLNQAVHSDTPLEHLTQADVHLNLLRTYLRLGLELKHTSPDQYRHASEHMEELGRLLGGWQKKA
jgi:hypothetical protein